VPADPFEQLDLALENLCRNLQAANMDVQDILKLTFYLVGRDGCGKATRVDGFLAERHKPCMTLIHVAALASPVYKVEIDGWARQGELSGLIPRGNRKCQAPAPGRPSAYRFGCGKGNPRAVIPPSTGITTPLMNAPASDARYAAQ